MDKQHKIKYEGFVFEYDSAAELARMVFKSGCKMPNPYEPGHTEFDDYSDEIIRLKDIRSTKREPSTVGEILRDEFLDPMQITPEEFAKSHGFDIFYIHNLLCNDMVLDAKNAIKLSKALDTTPEFWLNIQYQSMLWEVDNYDQ